jgi:cytochrome c
MRIARVVLPVLLATSSLGPVPHVAGQPLEGNPSRGAAVFWQCVACHSVEPGVHLTGPSLAAIWGRRAGTVGGFGRYSSALKHAGITWDAPTLDRWLARPEALVPETTMTFAGVADARQRADLIAYLKAVTEGHAPPAPSGGMMGAGSRSDLKQVGKDRRVTAIRHCGDAYHVTTEAGRTTPFWEFNLRFKTDSSPLGPSPGKPVLAPAGMRGDRAQVVFSGLDDLKRFLVERCEGDER